MSQQSGCSSASIALANQLISVLDAHHALRSRGPRTVIAIAGESGSGKSVTALCLAAELSAANLNADVLHQDNYFVRPPATNHAHRERDLGSVGPNEVDFERLCAHVAAFRTGENGVVAPQVDYRGNRFGTRTHDFAPLSVLIVEGTYVLSQVHSDIRIFLEATSGDTRERRRARNRDIDAPIVDKVLAIEHGLIAPQADRADIIIDRDFTIARAVR